MQTEPAHLVSLNWDHPLPTAVVALALRPQRLTIIAPRTAKPSAQRAQELLSARGLSVDVRFGHDATDLDVEANAGGSMRATISKVMTGPGVWLDYTGGSKPMAAWARTELGRDDAAAARAVYLDVLSGVVRSDDGGQLRPEVRLTPAELGGLHGAKVTRVGAPDENPGFVKAALAEGAWIVDRFRQAGRRPPKLYFWGTVADAVGDPARTAWLDALVKNVENGDARVLPLWLERAGDWLELYVAELVRAVAGDGGDIDVSINVEARRQFGPAVTRTVVKKPPATRALLRALTSTPTPSNLRQLLTEAQSPAGGRIDDHSQDTDFEIDVVAVRGHRVYALSCYAGHRAEEIEWKANEIARRAVQLGGDHARAAFVCLASADQLTGIREILSSPEGGRPRVTVFGVDDLAAWASDPAASSLAQFLDLDRRTAVPRVARTSTAAAEHDLLVTVGGSPIPVFQSIIAHQAQEPLLVHDTAMRATAERLRTALATYGVAAQLHDVGTAFSASSVAAAFADVPDSVAVDITGGTKVMATQALLHQLRSGSLEDATYVDGRGDALRRIGRSRAEQLPPVPIDIVLQLHGWEMVDHAPGGEPSLPTRPPSATIEVAAAAQLAGWVAASVQATGGDAEAFASAKLRRPPNERTEQLDLVVRRGNKIGALAILWSTDQKAVAHAAWSSLNLAETALGAYTHTAVLAPVSEHATQHLERGMQRRSAGAPRTRVFGQSTLMKWERGDLTTLTQWP